MTTTTDNRVNIEQSASGRLEGRVLQKKRNDKRRNYICDVRTVSHSYNVLEVNLLGVFCLIWSCIYLPGVCPNKLGVMASHSPSNTAKNFKYKYIWYWQIHLVIQIHFEAYEIKKNYFRCASISRIYWGKSLSQLQFCQNHNAVLQIKSVYYSTQYKFR